MSLANVKAGDKVIVQKPYNYDSVGTVEEITPSGYIRVDGSLYHKTGALRGGDSFNRTRIEAATDESLEKIRKEKYIRVLLGKLGKAKISYEMAVEIDAVLTKYKEA